MILEPVSHLPQRLALIGMPGVGKTTVGMQLAQQLQCSFVDLDEVICRITGQTIHEFYQRYGEMLFRVQEWGALEALLALPQPLVLACGGGTWLHESIRKLLVSCAHPVLLTASLDTLIARLHQSMAYQSRPLLSQGDLSQNLALLQAERGKIYALCEHVYATDYLTPTDVAQNIAKLWPLATNTTSQSVKNPNDVCTQIGLYALGGAGPYPIYVLSKVTQVSDILMQHAKASQIALVTDENVPKLYTTALAEQLQQQGYACSVHLLPTGEQHKVLATAAMLYNELAMVNLSRHGLLVAIGGGVVGDITGFVASTYLRGVSFVQVPTTTLAAIDASVGGKNGLNTQAGKNQIGTFYPPVAVVLVPSYWQSQPLQVHAAGLVEAVKIAMTCDAALLAYMHTHAAKLLAHEPSHVLHVVRQAIALKAAVVAQDERERGWRAILNFGHTIGHAIETAKNYELLHGEAVALGMVAECAWAVAQGLIAPQVQSTLVEVLTALHMPVAWQHNHIDSQALWMDKKRQAQEILLPIVQSVGSVVLRRVSIAELDKFMQERSIL